MRIVRVEYTVTLTREDGKTASVKTERILSELESIEPEYIQQVLEQEVPASEQPVVGQKTAGSSLVVTKITELKPTGDDDQM